MLTEAEKKWLEERKPPTKQPYKTTADDNFCRYCARYNTHCTPWFRDVAYCPTDKGGDFKDAAEFESRVAARLAETAGDIALLLKQAGLEQLSDWQLLRITRLAVEEEMQ